MPVPVIVDGYNLLYARGETPAAASRARLVHRPRRVGARPRTAGWCSSSTPGRGARGRRARRRTGPVTVYFTRAGELADTYIVRWVAAHPEAVVVTSDRAVQQGARRRGAAVLDAESFAARLGGDDAAGPAPRAGPVRAPAGAQAAWLRGL